MERLITVDTFSEVEFDIPNVETLGTHKLIADGVMVLTDYSAYFVINISDEVFDAWFDDSDVTYREALQGVTVGEDSVEFLFECSKLRIEFRAHKQKARMHPVKNGIHPEFMILLQDSDGMNVLCH